MAANNGNGKAGSWSTPENILLLLKEIVTALIGLGVMGFTFYVAYKTFTHVGDTTRIADAKDILMLMMGLAGVVVGYYFGRVPADARAAQAQDMANTATARAEQLSSEVQSVADDVEAIMSRLPAPAGTGAPAVAAASPDLTPDIKAVRDRLRKMASPTR